MDTVLLDTNVISYLLKGDSRADAYAELIAGKRLAISFMTIAELFQWAGIRNWGEHRKAQLEKSLLDYLMLPYDFELCKWWGQVRTECQSKGRRISPQDAWIAATALHYELPLVTHNVTDFEAIENLTILTIS